MAVWDLFISLLPRKACCRIYSFRLPWDAGRGWWVVLGATVTMLCGDAVTSVPCWLFFFQEYLSLGSDFVLGLCSGLCGLHRYFRHVHHRNCLWNRLKRRVATRAPLHGTLLTLL